nr:immunoglobulin heavy chain junction region [Macaca mulatta]MOV37969.1 immunoglobulin heavy chain junction region [Macaca mulatta]MOV38060.1 immunoglobulin heavy chain junction region [Macaca mulatta]MOV38172.1 immunoglobulin heavy chain junction region [Macaca mulatta]MOV38226.1 immunoglobulin heavy chain junction region [Macaca mulatta]
CVRLEIESSGYWWTMRVW